MEKQRAVRVYFKNFNRDCLEHLEHHVNLFKTVEEARKKAGVRYPELRSLNVIQTARLLKLYKKEKAEKALTGGGDLVAGDVPAQALLPISPKREPVIMGNPFKSTGDVELVGMKMVGQMVDALSIDQVNRVMSYVSHLLVEKSA